MGRGAAGAVGDGGLQCRHRLGETRELPVDSFAVQFSLE